ncbi:MAG: HYC_CC_PP family protein [Sphingobacteriales bacterium]|jgi:hypothetical protein
MRKCLTIIVALFYLIATCGVVVSTHYCMGEVAGYALGQNDEHLCTVCGMTNEGCCHDDLNIYKIDDNHQVANSLYTGLDVISLSPVEKPHFSNYFPENKRVVFTHGLAPPLDIDRHAFLCVYRI